MISKLTASLGLFGLSLACGSVEDPPLGSSSDALSASSPGSVVMPIKVSPNRPFRPVMDPKTGGSKSAWDGSYLEILLADAYGLCVAEVAGLEVPSFLNGNEYPALSQAIVGFEGVEAKMGESPCPVIGAPGYDFDESGMLGTPPSPVEWAFRRSTSTCNENAESGTQGAAFELPATNPVSPVLDFVDWANAQTSFTLSEKDGELETNSELTQSLAYRRVHLAQVSLCVSQRLDALLDDGAMLTATTEEHVLLQSLAHQTAQTAMVELGRVLNLSTKSGSPPEGNEGSVAVGAYLRHWMDDHEDVVSVIEASFHRAVRLTAVTAMDFAQYLERQAGARWTTASNQTAFNRDWGYHSARGRLMNLVFGGAVLDDIWGSATNEAPEDYWFTPVRAQSGDPRVAVMFTLARAADALYLSFFPNVGEGPTGLNGESGEEIYYLTELWSRKRGCSGDVTGCSEAAIAAEIAAIESAEQYDLFRHYGVSIDHADALAQAIFDSAVFPEMSGESDESGTGVFHLSGQHEFVAHRDRDGATSQWLHIDPNTVRFPYSFADRAELGRSFCSNRVPDWLGDLGDCELPSGVVTSQRDAWLGAVPALAFAKEVLFELGKDGATSARSEIRALLDTLLGPVTAIQRPDALEVIVSKTSSMPSVVHASGALARHEIKAAARDRSYVGARGVSREELDELPGETADLLLQGEGSASAWKVGRWESSAVAEGTAALLRSTDGAATSYIYLARRPEASGGTAASWASATVVTGGWFVELLRRVTAVEQDNWERPKFDGFGLSTKAVPPADASLIGGSAGEESYAYLLRTARTAADEATSAVSAAIETLEAEARDDGTVEQTRARADRAAELELQALCGEDGDCVLPMSQLDTRWPETGIGEVPAPCEGLEDVLAVEKCVDAITSFNQVLPSAIPLPMHVVGAVSITGDGKTTLSSLPQLVPGSELQRVLQRQWNATYLLFNARDQAGDMAAAYGAQMAQLEAAKGAAGTEYSAAASQAQALLLASDIADQSAKDEFEASFRQDQAAGERAETQLRNTTYHCRETEKYGGDIDALVLDCGGGDYVDHADCGEVWNEGDTQSAASIRCLGAVQGWLDAQTVAADAHDAYLDAWLLYEGGDDPRTAAVEDLPGQLDAHSAQNQAITDSLSAAAQKKTISELQAVSGMVQALVQLESQTAVLRQILAELYQSREELNLLQAKASQVKVRALLENDLAEDAHDINAKVRRNYRSYDVWRAKAMLENARRIAVSARRGIEARFVVDLSTLSANQSSVDSPASWADEVFESDLDAPAVVGLSAAPEIEGVVYPTKLSDYIGNLEKFVQGYTMTYPTSVSLPDSEVITLPGPEMTPNTTGVQPTHLDPDSEGWRFYCANSGTWITHPGVGEYPLLERLSTACGGNPPTLAKLGFWLDPWGMLGGSWTHPQYSDRHNVRWRRLAVNLVGTGIRDCANATDSTDCFTNPFLRFNLLHAGPSWQTNHAGDWRTVDIPTSHIEAGKALAAEEWLEPVNTSWNMPFVANVARGELFGRPMAGDYELVLEIGPDTRLDRIERIQLLVEQDYWVRQTGGATLGEDPPTTDTEPSGVGGAAGVGGATGAGGESGSGGSVGTGGASGGDLEGSCVATTGSDDRIDDFEDGDSRIGTWDGRLGYWYGFHAGTTCTAVPDTGDELVPEAPGYNSVYAGRTWGDNCYQSGTNSWSGGGIGFAFLSEYSDGSETVCGGTSTSSGYDATYWSGIEFDIKGVGYGSIRVDVCEARVVDGNCHGIWVNFSPTFAHLQVNFSAMYQGSGGTLGPLQSDQIKKIEFVSLAAPYDFTIDNVSFY